MNKNPANTEIVETEVVETEVVETEVVETESASCAELIQLLSQGPILLYDGECGVCSASIQWILAHERQHHLRFAALQSDVGRRLRMCAKIPEYIDSVIWVEADGEQIKAHLWSSGLVAVLSYVGGPWRALSWIRIIARPLRDAAYRLFAKHRLKFAPSTCLIPPPETRVRFLKS